MSTIAIVGNAPLSQSDREAINQCDVIVRFNLTPNIRSEPTARTTELFLSCSSKQIGEYLSKKHYAEDPAFKNTSRIVLTYNPEIIRLYMRSPSFFSKLKGRRADWSRECLCIARENDKETELLTTETYFNSCGLLGIEGKGKDYFPSSGFLATVRALDSERSDVGRIHLFGFSFQGWKRHHWSKEKEVLTSLHRSGEIRFHPVAPEVSSKGYAGND